MLYLIYSRQITVGQFFSLFIYSFFIFGPLQELGNVINVYREAEVSLGNFEQILRTPKEPRPENPVLVGGLEELRFEDVRFTHASATRPALDGVSFRVRRGETVAFVGPSGAGKTTLVKLLVGLYPPQGGRGALNGHAEHDRGPRPLPRAHRPRDPGHPALLGHHPREPALRAAPTPPTRSAWRCSARRPATRCSRVPTRASTP